MNTPTPRPQPARNDVCILKLFEGLTPYQIHAMRERIYPTLEELRAEIVREYPVPTKQPAQPMGAEIMIE